MPRKYLMVIAVTLLSVTSFISFATAATKKQQEEAPYVANFTYTPESQAAPGSAVVASGLASVNYQSDTFTPWLTWPQFANLDAAIKQDLTKLFAAKGVTLRGFVDSHDLIPYQDKKSSDFYMLPTLELSITLKGDAWVSGKFTMLFREIMTGELMWSKTIPLTGFSVHNLHTFRPKGSDDENFKIIVDLLDVRNRNDMAKGVEKEYPELMATIAKLIDPEEMSVLRKQCQELRSKKGY